MTKELRNLGIKAFSCDTLECSGGYPEWHLQGDVTPLLNKGWAMIIAFPPCTHLANSGAKWFAIKQADGRQPQAIDFFMSIANAQCERIAIENPVGVMSRHWRKPDQIVQPYMFGDSYTKTTCLWLKGLPKLTPTNIVDRGEMVVLSSGKVLPKWYSNAPHKTQEERAKARSKTFPGIAKAMAEQWGPVIQHATGL